MKRELGAIVREAIKESELNGYKWSLKGDRLTWSYLSVEYFKIEIGEEYGDKYVKISLVWGSHLDNLEESWIYVLVGEEFYNDAKTVEEGLKLAVKRAIRKANNRF